MYFYICIYICISSHTPPHAIGTLSTLPSRPCKDIIPHPQRCPLLPLTEGLLAKVWDHPPSPLKVNLSRKYKLSSIIIFDISYVFIYMYFYVYSNNICNIFFCGACQSSNHRIHDSLFSHFDHFLTLLICVKKIQACLQMPK